MNPLQGQHVKITLNNNTVLEGKVVKWSDEKSVLKNDEKVFIIQKTVKDVLMIEISLHQHLKQPIADTQHSSNISFPERQIYDEVQENSSEEEILSEEERFKNDKFQELVAKPKKSFEDLKELAELKKDLNKIELRLYSNQLKSRIPNNIPQVQYALPRFPTQQSPFQRTSEKDTRENFPGSTKLSKMFQNKNKE